MVKKHQHGLTISLLPLTVSMFLLCVIGYWWMHVCVWLVGLNNNMQFLMMLSLFVFMCAPLCNWARMGACVFVRLYSLASQQLCKSGWHGRLIAAFWGTSLPPTHVEAAVESDLHIAHYLFAISWLYFLQNPPLPHPVICIFLFFRLVLQALRNQPRYPSTLRLTQILLLSPHSPIRTLADLPFPHHQLILFLSPLSWSHKLVGLLIMLIDAFSWDAMLTCRASWFVCPPILSGKKGEHIR